MMSVLCVFSAHDGMDDSNGACPFGQRDVISSGNSCPWKDSGRCGYKAVRQDLMKSLSLLCTKVFEMSKTNNIPTDIMTEACLLMNSTRELLENNRNNMNK